MPNEPVRVFDGSKYTEVVTDAGAILYCRVVPPFAQTVVHRRMPAPPLPRVEVVSASGDSSETHLALPGTPEHDAYLVAKAEHRREFGLALQRFLFTYGVVAWRSAPGEEAQFNPPTGWAIDPILVEYGVEQMTGPDYRAQYILYELILTEVDLIKVELATSPSPTVTEEDVAAGLAPFVSSTEESPSSMDNPIQETSQAQE